jgi:hypothetical protein
MPLFDRIYGCVYFKPQEYPGKSNPLMNAAQQLEAIPCISLANLIKGQDAVNAKSQSVLTSDMMILSADALPRLYQQRKRSYIKSSRHCGDSRRVGLKYSIMRFAAIRERGAALRCSRELPWRLRPGYVPPERLCTGISRNDIKKSRGHESHEVSRYLKSLGKPWPCDSPSGIT